VPVDAENFGRAALLKLVVLATGADVEDEVDRGDVTLAETVGGSPVLDNEPVVAAEPVVLEVAAMAKSPLDA